MRFTTFSIAILFILMSLTTKASQQPMKVGVNTQNKIDSIYTDLSSSGCKTIELDEESAFSTQLCQGVGNYKLLVEDFDARSSITIVSPDGKKHPLNYTEVITYGFSSLGAKAEWRVKKENGKDIPFALITRLNTNEQPEKPENLTSYLIVSKITKEKICVIAKVLSKSDANIEARQIADNSATKPCLQTTR